MSSTTLSYFRRLTGRNQNGADELSSPPADGPLSGRLDSDGGSTGVKLEAPKLEAPEFEPPELDEPE